jgi:hypothetical protein
LPKHRAAARVGFRFELQPGKTRQLHLRA